MSAARPIALDAALDPESCGQKSATLAKFRRMGYRVPDGFVITATDNCSPEAVREALDRLGPGPYAVRSSAALEDLAEASFAGQYETVLGVETLDEVLAATDKVRKSQSAPGDAGYGVINGEAPFAVLVQRLVDPSVAGVAFSANPVTGDDEVVIEAVRGLGDRLASGEIEGDRWIVTDGTPKAARDEGVIDAATATRIAELTGRVAMEQGRPQDIEWAIRDGELYLLQARPITGLPLPPTFEVPPGQWAKDTSHFSGPMTAVGASILLPVYEAALASVFEEFGLPLETIRHRSFGGEIYTQDIEVGGKHDPSPPPPWWVLAVAVRIAPPMRRRIRAAAEAVNGGKLEEYPRLWKSKWRDETIARLNSARSVALSDLSDRELLDELQRVIDNVLLPSMVTHFQLAIPHMVGMSELVNCCEELLEWELHETMELLRGLSPGSVTPTREEIVGDTIDLWSWRTIDSDPGTPTLGERTELLPEEPSSSDELATVRSRAVREARAALEGNQRDRFDRALAFAEAVYPVREDNVLYTEGIPCGLVRRVLLEIGRRLAESGALLAATDISFLERDELEAALLHSLDGEPAELRVRRRKAERAWVLAHPGPLTIGPPAVPPPDVRGFPAPARRIVGSVLWAISNELSPASSERNHDDAVVSGLAASPGRYTGPVRIVRSEEELTRVASGDVLVCQTTHSGWSPIFRRVGAIVTDGGGVLSHPAIIAREHDIPAVVATGCAMSRLREGQIVTVDGSAGVVR